MDDYTLSNFLDMLARFGDTYINETFGGGDIREFGEHLKMDVV